MIAEEKKHKLSLLERDPPSRDLRIIDQTDDQDSHRKQMAEEEKKQVMDEEEYEESMMNKGVLKMMRENEKNRKFQSKRMQ